GRVLRAPAGALALERLDERAVLLEQVEPLQRRRLVRDGVGREGGEWGRGGNASKVKHAAHRPRACCQPIAAFRFASIAPRKSCVVRNGWPGPIIRARAFVTWAEPRVSERNAV